MTHQSVGPSNTDRVEVRPPGEDIERLEGTAGAFLAALQLAFSDDDPDAFDRSIEDLRNDSSFLETAESLYESQPEDSSFRWGVLYVVSRVAPLGAMTWLETIALQDLPDEDDAASFCETKRDGELLVGTMAVEGLGLLTKTDGVDVVLKSLQTVISGDVDPAIRSAAVVQFLKIDAASRDRIRALLPKRMEYLADVHLEVDPARFDERPSSLGLDAGDSPVPPSTSNTEVK